MKYIDLTHLIVDGMLEWPGCQPVQLKTSATVANNGVANHQLTGSCHLGTHLDAPGHFIAHGRKICDYPIEKFTGKVTVIDARGAKQIDLDLVQDQVKPNTIVLFYTGWDKHFNTPDYFKDYPEITAPCAQYLVNQKVKMVGIDGPSVDFAPFSIHKLLLSSEILIIENLTNLNALMPYSEINLLALPLNIDAHGAPARVVAYVIL